MGDGSGGRGCKAPEKDGREPLKSFSLDQCPECGLDMALWHRGMLTRRLLASAGAARSKQAPQKVADALL